MHGGRVNKMNILSTGLEIFVRLCITSIFALARSSWWPVLIDAPKNEWHSMQLKEIYYFLSSPHSVITHYKPLKKAPLCDL